jgi:hypothetical protein
LRVLFRNIKVTFIIKYLKGPNEVASITEYCTEQLKSKSNQPSKLKFHSTTATDSQLMQKIVGDMLSFLLVGNLKNAGILD